MSAKGAWLGNAAWPSNRSCGQFARDVFRIAGAKTDKQKALAFFEWFTRCMMRGRSLDKPDGCGGYSRCYEPLTLLSSWGFGECTFWGWVATACLVEAGLKARRIVVENQGHTYYEIWYKGDDGVEQWHAFDPFIGWYALNESGEVASVEQLAKNPNLIQYPYPGHPDPMGHHPERSGMCHRTALRDQLIIDQPMRFRENQWNLQKGMQVTHKFFPEASDRALFTRSAGPGETTDDRNPDGTHCDIAEISGFGYRQQPKNIPYWKNYMWPTREGWYLNEGRPVRWNGAGAIHWRPLMYGAEVACDVRNAKFENGRLMPAKQHDFTEVWYHFQLPYLASWLYVDYDVVGAGNDYWCLSISGDDRQSWWQLPLKSRAPHWGVIQNGQAEWKRGERNICGLKEFWLRIDMASHNPNPTLAVNALQFGVGFQHNMHVQPRLVPGENNLWLEAAELAAGSKLQAEWIYQIDEQEKRACVGLSKAGRAEEAVKIDVDCPSKVLMTGIRLSCL